MSDLPERLGRYDVLGELATGGMAQILLARIVGPSGFERAVVIKRILPHLARRDAFVSMFLDEARIAAQIRHHNVVHVHELSRENGELALVMEYLEGESVSSLTRRLFSHDEALDRRLAAYIVAEACAGLHAAHELVDAEGRSQNVVHRDISPQNLFVAYDGLVKVIDFGIAKAADRITETEAGQLKGKFEYMSPEQCHGMPLDRRSDVFALGVVLYELTTGRRLFKRREGAAAIIRAITSEPIVPPSRIASDYPPALERACMHALATSRDERTPTAAELRREVLAAMRELSPLDDAGAALGALMKRLFADRVEEKREMLHRMRAGKTLSHVPAGEIDVDVDVPVIDVVPAPAAEAGATGVETPSTTAARQHDARRAKRRWLVFAVSAALALFATFFAVRTRRTHDAPVNNDVAPLPTPSATTATTTMTTTATSASSAAASVAVASPTILLSLSSDPAGAEVSVAGEPRGTTPLELHLPRGATPVELTLRRAGFETLVESIVPDTDQRLRLALHARVVVKSPPAGAGGAATSAAPKPEPFTKWN